MPNEVIYKLGDLYWHKEFMFYDEIDNIIIRTDSSGIPMQLNEITDIKNQKIYLLVFRVLVEHFPISQWKH